MKAIADPAKTALLKHYSQPDMSACHYVQYDGWLYSPDDDLMPADEDGDVLFALRAMELRSSGTPVRIQILQGTSPQDAVRLLRKMLAFVEKSYESLATDLNEESLPWWPVVVAPLVQTPEPTR